MHALSVWISEQILIQSSLIFIIHKLSQLTVPNSICNWITNFLTDRGQKVKLRVLIECRRFNWPYLHPAQATSALVPLRVHFSKKLLLIIYSPPCHPIWPCLSFFSQKEIKVFDEVFFFFQDFSPYNALYW